MTSDTLASSDAIKPVAYVLVGLPGSGKSTWAARHPEKLPIASTDAFIEAYAAENRIDYATAFKQFEVQAKQLLRQRLNSLIASRSSFIWDQTNITARKRRAVYQKLSTTHQVIYVCFCVPMEVCMARVEARERQSGEVINRNLIRFWSRLVTFPDAGEPADGIIPIIHPSFMRR